MKAINFRYTQSGWVVDVRDGDALLSYSVKADEINARDCENFQDAYATMKTLPYGAKWGDVFDIAPEWQIEAEAEGREFVDVKLTEQAAIHDGVSSPAWWDRVKEAESL